MKVHTLRIPTPLSIGPVNVFLIADDPITLVDVGPNTGEALESLRGQLSALGVPLEAVRRIVITHAHEDHAGLAARIKQLHDATVYIHPWEQGQMAAPLDYMLRQGMLRQVGVPPEVIAEVDARRRKVRQNLPPAPEMEPLQEGARLPFASGGLRVIHSPGHTPGQICLWQESERELFGSDALLKKITPNPLMNLDPSCPERRFPSLKRHLDTLSRLRKLRPSFVHTGHGDNVDDVEACCERTLKHIQARQDRLLEMFPAKPTTAWEMSQLLFSETVEPHRYLALSDVSAHIDYAAELGKLVGERRDGVEYYRRSG